MFNNWYDESIAGEYNGRERREQSHFKNNLIKVTFIQGYKHRQKFLNLNMVCTFFQPFKITASHVFSSSFTFEHTLL